MTEQTERPTRRRLSPETADAIREMAAEDLTDQEIATRLRVHHETATLYRNDLELPPSTRQRGPRRTQVRRERVRELVDAGLRDAQIAERLDISARTVLRDREAMSLPPASPRFVKGERRGTSAPHGTVSRYNYERYCDCGPCLAANAKSHNAYLHKSGRFKRYRVHCDTCGSGHLVDDPQSFTCPNPPKEGTS